jgi:hypothetical protein
MQRPPRADEERDEPEEPERAPSLLSARELQVTTPARNPARTSDVEPADDEDESPAKDVPKQQRKKR